MRITNILIKLEHLVQFISKLFIIIIGVVFVSWYTDDTLPVKNAKLIQHTENIYAGGWFEAIFHIEKTRTDCRMEIYRYIKDSRGYLHPIDMKIEEFPNEKTYVRVTWFKVPENMPSGKAVYISKINYYCNPIKEIAHTPKPLLLEITEFNVKGK